MKKKNAEKTEQAPPVGMVAPATPMAVVDPKEVEARTYLRRIGAEIVVETVKVGQKYLELCRYIRQHQVGPKWVSEELSALGFHKVRISEINRVSNAAEDIWREFEAASIGFKKCLQLTRGSVEVIRQAGVMADDNVASVAEASAIVAEEKGQSEESGEAGSAASDDPIHKQTIRLHKAANIMASAADELELISKTWHIGGYTVHVFKDKKKKKPATVSAS